MASNAYAAHKMRQLRAQRRQQGRCIYCGEPAETKTMCRRHADEKRRSDEPLRYVSKKNYPVRRRSKHENQDPTPNR